MAHTACVSVEDFCKAYIDAAASNEGPAELMDMLHHHAEFVREDMSAHGTTQSLDVAQAAMRHKTGMHNVMVSYLLLNRDHLESDGVAETTAKWYGACRTVFATTQVGGHYKPDNDTATTVTDA
jgi:hypothetical protein